MTPSPSRAMQRTAPARDTGCSLRLRLTHHSEPGAPRLAIAELGVGNRLPLFSNDEYHGDNPLQACPSSRGFDGGHRGPVDVCAVAFAGGLALAFALRRSSNSSRNSRPDDAHPPSTSSALGRR